MAYRNPATINATKGLQEFIVFANEVTNYWFSNMIVVSVFLISLSYYLYIYGTKDFWSGAAIAGYFTFIIALFLWLMDALTGTTMTIVIGMMTLFTLALWLSHKESS